MIILLVASVFTFFFYYLSCISRLFKHKYSSIALFVLFSILLRNSIDIDKSADYLLYFNFQIFCKPDDMLAYLFKEPYLYAIYSFFNIISNDKIFIFSCLYWFNYAIVTAFFVWLILRIDVEIWKKMVLFTLYYVLFAFVLLRNAPVYILFGILFYNCFRDISKNLYFILLTPFMHLSSVVILPTLFYRSKHYLKFYVIFLFFVIIIIFFSLTFLQGISSIQTLLFKLNFYTRKVKSVGIIHQLFFLSVVSTYLVNLFYSVKRMMHPILITSFLIYFISFFINSSVSFRFSPYILFALFFCNLNESKILTPVKYIDFYSVVLLPFFLYTLWYTQDIRSILF